MRHAHAAGELIAPFRERRQIHNGTPVRGQVRLDAEGGEHHPLRAGTLLAPVELQPQRHPGPGQDPVWVIAALNDDRGGLRRSRAAGGGGDRTGADLTAQGSQGRPGLAG